MNIRNLVDTNNEPIMAGPTFIVRPSGDAVADTQLGEVIVPADLIDPSDGTTVLGTCEVHGIVTTLSL